MNLAFSETRTTHTVNERAKETTEQGVLALKPFLGENGKPGIKPFVLVRQMYKRIADF